MEGTGGIRWNKFVFGFAVIFLKIWIEQQRSKQAFLRNTKRNSVSYADPSSLFNKT
jgi:hypothetical protein